MEDALAQQCTRVYTIFVKVLILVLMEDALAQLLIVMHNTYQRSLNPCFNGRCTRTDKPVEGFVADENES